MPRKFQTDSPFAEFVLYLSVCTHLMIILTLFVAFRHDFSHGGGTC